jgi:hypothetical protein
VHRQARHAYRSKPVAKKVVIPVKAGIQFHERRLQAGFQACAASVPISKAA